MILLSLRIYVTSILLYNSFRFKNLKVMIDTSSDHLAGGMINEEKMS